MHEAAATEHRRRRGSRCRTCSTAAAPGRRAVGRGGLRPTAQGMYEQALRDAGRTPLSLRAATWSRALPVDRWCADADAADAAVLEPFAAALPDRAELLDLGCGPGRHTACAARDAGLRALGVDSSPVCDRPRARPWRPRPCSRTRSARCRPGHHAAGTASCCWTATSGSAATRCWLLCRVRDLLRPRGRRARGARPRWRQRRRTGGAGRAAARGAPPSPRARLGAAAAAARRRALQGSPWCRPGTTAPPRAPCSCRDDRQRGRRRGRAAGAAQGR